MVTTRNKWPMVAALGGLVAAAAGVFQAANPWAIRFLDKTEPDAQHNPTKSSEPRPTLSLGSFTLAEASEAHGPYRMGRRYGIDLDAWIERDALKTPNEQRLKRMWEYRESRSAWDHVCISLYFSQEEWYAQESSFDHEQAWKLHVMHLLDPDQDRQYWAERSRKRREIKDLYDRNERAGRRCGVSAAAPVP